MRTLQWLTVMVVISMLLLPAATEAGVRHDRPNLVGGEILGRGLFLTANYERFFSNTLGLGAGFMGIGTSDGAGIILPIYVAVVAGDVHSPYFSGGFSLLAGGEGVNDWARATILHFSAGYQYQSNNGFFIRPIFSLLLPTDSGSGDEWLLWPGLTIGGSF